MEHIISACQILVKEQYIDMIECDQIHFNPLASNDLYVANSVSKFGAILFSPIRLTVVACDALGPLKVRLAFRQQNVPRPPPKPHPPKRRYKRRPLELHSFPADLIQL